MSSGFAFVAAITNRGKYRYLQPMPGADQWIC